MTTKELQAVSDLLDDKLDRKFKSILDDISYRIGVMYDSAHNTRMTSRDLNLPMHQLDGFTITDNSPAAGSVAWSDCHIVYKGTNYAITNGNSNLKYIWWDYDAVPNTVFQASATKPTLTDDDVLICTNNAGVHNLVVGQGRMVNGAILLDGTVQGNELANDAVTALKIADSAVTAGKIGSGAVIEGKLGSGAVTVDKIGSNAVTEGKINTGAVTVNKIGSGAITDAKIASNAVTSDKINAGAVVEGKLSSGAVTADKIGSGAVTETKIGNLAVTSGKLADGSVINAKLGAGAVATDKLNLAQHLLF